jgi:hypothetical protein
VQTATIIARNSTRKSTVSALVRMKRMHQQSRTLPKRRSHLWVASHTMASSKMTSSCSRAPYLEPRNVWSLFASRSWCTPLVGISRRCSSNSSTHHQSSAYVLCSLMFTACTDSCSFLATSMVPSKHQKRSTRSWEHSRLEIDGRVDVFALCCSLLHKNTLFCTVT